MDVRYDATRRSWVADSPWNATLFILSAAVFFRRALTVAAIVLGGVAALHLVNNALSAPASTSSTVKIDLGHGHGSGVYLGKGVILTAAHVVDGEKEITIVTESGTRTPAEVLWASTRYDVALVQAPLEGVARSTLTCRTAKVGDELKATGHPQGQEWMTTFGRVAKGRHAQDDWPSVLSVDITGGAGMSGGPVFNTEGFVAGITVAGFPNRFPVRSFMLVVPSSTICRLMGR